jgi:hypothetical protein
MMKRRVFDDLVVNIIYGYKKEDEEKRIKQTDDSFFYIFY